MFALLPGTQYLVPERRWVEEIIMMTSDLSVCAFTWYSVLGSRAALGGRNNHDDL